MKVRLSKKVAVHNLHHGTDEDSKFLRKWAQLKGFMPATCSNLNCENELKNPALVGAHVQKDGNDTEDTWYICPLCHKCNSDDNDESMEVYDHRLVPLADINNL